MQDIDETPENASTPIDADSAGGAGSDASAGENTDDADTFPRDYVENLRQESKGYREKASAAEARTDELSRALFAARVAATGKVENAAEIEYNADMLDDADALNTAIDAAIEARPYIKTRKPSGNIGQGVKGTQTEQFSLLGALKGAV